jgi:hypothetical protein
MASKPGGLLLPGIGLTLKRRLSPTEFIATLSRLNALGGSLDRDAQGFATLDLKQAKALVDTLI